MYERKKKRKREAAQSQSAAKVQSPAAVRKLSIRSLHSIRKSEDERKKFKKKKTKQEIKETVQHEDTLTLGANHFTTCLSFFFLYISIFFSSAALRFQVCRSFVSPHFNGATIQCRVFFFFFLKKNQPDQK